jgi:hypothetical protein
MFSTVPAMRFAEKAVAATVICGALAFGTGGIASAATPTTTAPTATGHHKCARADKALTKVTKAESAIASRLTKWQAAETKQVAAGHTKIAARIEDRITKLQKAQTKAGSLASKIQTKCPTASTS